MKKTILLILVLITINLARAEEEISNKNFSNLNITSDSTKNLDELKKTIDIKQPKTIFVEHWLANEKENKNLLKDIRKYSKKYKSKIFLVTGKSTWFAEKGVENTIEVLNEYEKKIDGIVLRVEPNKTNIWQKNNINYQAQVLNSLLDTYLSVYKETKKRKKLFYAEFPFWLSTYQGPKSNFPQDACGIADKIVFLIDDNDKLDDLEMGWNDVTCRYLINISKRPSQSSEETTEKMYKTIEKSLSFYTNFYGYIIDSDSKLIKNDDLISSKK